MYIVILVLALIALLAPTYLKGAVLLAAAFPVIMFLIGFLLLGIMILTGKKYTHVRYTRVYRNFSHPINFLKKDDGE